MLELAMLFSAWIARLWSAARRKRGDRFDSQCREASSPGGQSSDSNNSTSNVSSVRSSYCMREEAEKGVGRSPSYLQ